MRRCILLIVIAFAIAPAGLAQPPEPKKKFQVTVPYDGPEIFARFLDFAELKPIKSVDRFGVDAPADATILIVFGDPRPLVELGERRPGGLGGFLKSGGALLIATDREFPLWRLPTLGWDDITMEKGDLVNPLVNFENQEQCPLIAGKNIVRPEHPLFRDVHQPIATNCPGFIAGKNPALQPLALLPAGTFAVFGDFPLGNAQGKFIHGGLPRLHRGGEPYLVATRDNAPRALLAAGHGVFMNCMTVRKDIDNRRLAVNAIDWLKDGKRTHVLFINEGKVVETFKMPLIGAPKTPVPSLAAINRIIDAIQSEQILQKIIDRTIGPEPIIRGLIVLGTFGLLFYGIKKYFQSRYHLDATPAIVGVPPPKAPSLVKQQAREMVRRQQLGEPAQALARDWFRTYAKIEFPAGQPPHELSFDIHAGLLQRRKLAKHVKTLWTLASEPPPANWNQKKLRALAVFLEDLSLSVLAGEVVFDSPVARSPRS
jgi:hypothetical protein